MTLSPKHQVEALLFSSGKAMSVDVISELSRVDKAKVIRALKALKKDYDERDSALAVEQDGHEWKMTVRTEYLLLVKNIVADTELSRSCMETLAVIAYKYPKVLQSEVIDTRGSSAYEHIAELEKLGFVQKEKSGRSFALKLTEKFFAYFEVTGEKDIRAAFKNVKPPEKLGDLDIVEVPKDHQQKIPLDPVETPDTPTRPEQDSEHQKFLADLDKRIEQISGKNDDHDDDPSLQRLADEEPSEEEAKDS